MQFSLREISAIDLIEKIYPDPEKIGQLKKLTWLQLEGNRLRVLPAGIGHLDKLQELYLGDNRLKTLPGETGRLRNLKKLRLGNNPLPDKEKKKIRQLLPGCNITF